MEEFIKDCNKRGIHLAFVVSPEYFHYDSISYSSLLSLCQRYNVPYIDRSADEQYVGHLELFQDSLHMNYWGATKWSLFILQYIQELSIC